MKSKENKEALIQYRFEQANNSIDTVQLLITNSKYNAAINRIYYGMFYMLLAVAVKEGFETSKHQQLIGWFNKTFIKEGRLPKKFGKMVSQTFKSRQISDYEAFVIFYEEEVLQLFSDMKEFVFKIKEYIDN